MSVSPKRSVPIEVGASTLTEIVVRRLSVLKSAVKSMPPATTSLFQLVTLFHNPPAVFVHVPSAACSKLVMPIAIKKNTFLKQLDTILFKHKFFITNFLPLNTH
jgi:hypothetical protein